MEAFMGRYSGLVLYTREMDENAYSKICAVRFNSRDPDQSLNWVCQ